MLREDSETTEQAVQNTDRELFREVKDDYYSPNIFVTEQGGIGINVGGHVFVKSLRDWHELAEQQYNYEREMTESKTPKRICTIVIPDGYKDAEELAQDCGFELVKDVLVMQLQEGYTFLKAFHAPFTNKTPVDY